MDQTLQIGNAVLAGSYAFTSGDVLWVYVYAEISLADLFALLNEPENTQEITASRFGETTVFSGYTELFCIRKEEEGFLSAGLRKEKAG